MAIIEMHQIYNVRVERKHKRQLHALAKVYGCSLSELVRIALKNFLRDQKEFLPPEEEPKINIPPPPRAYVRTKK